MFQKEDWLDFSPENGTWFYRLYERDTDNGKNMRRAVDRLFRMDQEKREEIYEAVKHDMEFMDKRPGKRENSIWKVTSFLKRLRRYSGIFSGIFYDVVLCTTHFRLEGMSRSFTAGKSWQRTILRERMKRSAGSVLCAYSR